MYIGFSHHNVPSLSKVAMRSAGGTWPGPAWVTDRTKDTMASLVSPSRQPASGSLLMATPSLPLLASEGGFRLLGQIHERFAAHVDDRLLDRPALQLPWRLA